jgi:hypothetical protein
MGSSVLEELAASIFKRTGTSRGNLLLHYQDTWKLSSVMKMEAIGSFVDSVDLGHRRHISVVKNN